MRLRRGTESLVRGVWPLFVTPVRGEDDVSYPLVRGHINAGAAHPRTGTRKPTGRVAGGRRAMRGILRWRYLISDVIWKIGK
ncbi:hypothetical protein EDF39_0122 [Frondihabitans sp. PhB161]|nr:hypothetical protein EDF39_0122 [Frondihabitans sp. PhB161]